MIDKQTREPESNIVFTTKLGVETAEEKESTESLYEELEQQLEESQSGLADYVVAFFDKAKNYRENNGIDKRIVRALRRRKREYDPEDADLVASTADIYIPIIDLKCRAGLAWMTDILTNSDERPWTLTPTPEPEIPDDIKEIAIDRLKQELLARGLSDIGEITALAKEYKALARSFVRDRAEQACTRMESIISDKLLEGGWLEEFRKFLDDVCTYPTAFFEFPVLSFEKRLAWKNNELVEEEKLVHRCGRVAPEDVFPSEDSTSTQDGTGYIIRRRMTYKQIHACLGLTKSGFNEKNIRKVLDRFKDNGKREDLQNDTEEDYLKAKQASFEVDNGLVDVLCYYGYILGQHLLEMDILVEDIQKPYESVVWVVDGIPIYAVLNPFPLGKRPLYSTSFKKVNGSFYGEALTDLLESIERMANAAARSLARNMSYASGPIGEYDIDRISEEETDIKHVEPFRMYAIENPIGSNSTGEAIRFKNIDSHATELQKILEDYMKLADDVSGIPAYVLGNPQVAGAGRTMGGLSMLIGNAAKGIKHTLLNIDNDVIVPAVAMEYNLQMKFGTDQSAKVDAQVIARGSSGIMQRELAQTRTTELLQTITPFIQFIDPNGVKYLLREVLKSRGYNVDKIVPDPDAGQFFGGIKAAPSNIPSTMPGTPMPNLDGRSMPPPMPGDTSKLPVNPPFGG